MATLDQISGIQGKWEEERQLEVKKCSEQQQWEADQWQREMHKAWEKRQKEQQKQETEAMLEAIEKPYMEAYDWVMTGFRTMGGISSKWELKRDEVSKKAEPATTAVWEGCIAELIKTKVIQEAVLM